MRDRPAVHFLCLLALLPSKRKAMKKLFVLLAVAGLSLSVIGCGGETKKTEKKVETTTPGGDKKIEETKTTEKK